MESLERRSLRLGAALALGLGSPLAVPAAEERARWNFELEAVYVEVSGHDPHVLTERRAAGAEEVKLDTDPAFGYRGAVLYDRGRWAYGLDFFIHRTDQSAGPREAAAAAPGDDVTFEVPHHVFLSAAPGEVLYYQTLEDTTVELWVLDLAARRRFGAGDGGSWAFLFGLRNADFDNDYRAIAGLGDVGGTRIDASSNYSRMMGPLVGLAYTPDFGRHSFVADVRLAVVFGDIELTRTLCDFVGPPGPFAGPPEDVPPCLTPQRLHTTDSIEVPMGELRLAWRYRLGERWTLGAAFDATGWSDLAVPPGVDPDRPDALEETTLVTYGVGVSVGFRFGSAGN